MDRVKHFMKKYHRELISAAVAGTAVYVVMKRRKVQFVVQDYGWTPQGGFMLVVEGQTHHFLPPVGR